MTDSTFSEGTGLKPYRFEQPVVSPDFVALARAGVCPYCGRSGFKMVLLHISKTHGQPATGFRSEHRLHKISLLVPGTHRRFQELAVQNGLPEMARDPAHRSAVAESMVARWAEHGPTENQRRAIQENGRGSIRRLLAKQRAEGPTENQRRARAANGRVLMAKLGPEERSARARKAAATRGPALLAMLRQHRPDPETFHQAVLKRERQMSPEARAARLARLRVGYAKWRQSKVGGTS